MNWSSLFEDVYVQDPGGQEREVEGITWGSLPLYPSCRTLDLIENSNFNGTNASTEITFRLPLHKNYHDFSIFIQERNKLLTRRRLKSSMLAYTGPDIRAQELSVGFSLEVAVRMSQFIYLETDAERRCRNYPNQDFESYRACDEHFVHETLLRDYGLVPFWATDNLTEVTEKK